MNNFFTLWQEQGVANGVHTHEGSKANFDDCGANIQSFPFHEEVGPLKIGNIHSHMLESHQNYINVIGIRRELCGKKFDMLNHVDGLPIDEKRIITCDLKEPILDKDLGENRLGVIIMNYSNDK